MNSKLYVITAITNPVRYKNRYKLFEKFKKHMKESSVCGAEVELVTVECQHSDRDFVLTCGETKCDIQLRTNHELWHKENLLNIGISRLPQDWKYAAWLDADIEFVRPDWAIETIQGLKHYSVLQPFSHAIDLGPGYETLQVHKGFGCGYLNRQDDPGKHCNWGKGYEYWHTGFGWAIRRDAFDYLWNGLIDWAPLGSADHHMAWGLIGKIRNSVPKDISPRYLDCLLKWEDRAEKHICRNLGYVPGTILHSWHGKKKDRKYKERWDIITNNKFDPDLDLVRDWQGVWQLSNRSIGLRDDIRQYFRSRNEDSIDME